MALLLVAAGCSGCDEPDGDDTGIDAFLPDLGDDTGEPADSVDDTAPDDVDEPVDGDDAVDSDGESDGEDGGDTAPRDGSTDGDGALDTDPAELAPPPDVNSDGGFPGDALEVATDGSDGSGTARPCCLPDDSCAMTTRTNCGSQGGVVAIEAPDCSAVTCSNYTPKYACCSGGSCSEQTRPNCIASGNVSRIDRRCGQVSCTGAQARPCCLSGQGASFCLMYTTSDCQRLGGTPQQSGTCTQTQCGTGQTLSACCTDQGCVHATGTDCRQNLGGTSQTGQSCSSKPCP